MRISITLVALAIAGASMAQIYNAGTPTMTGSAQIGQQLSGVHSTDNLAYSNFVTGNGGYTQGAAAILGTDTFYTDYLVCDDIHPVATYVGQKITTIGWSFVFYGGGSASASSRMLLRLYSDGPGAFMLGLNFNPTTFNAGYYYTLSYNIAAYSLALPANLYAGLSIDNSGCTATAADLGLMGQYLFDPPGPGTSNDYFFKSTTQSNGLVNNPAGSFLWFGGNPHANFGWSFQTTPEPGTFAAIATGLVGLLALRRRK